jgi:hypothetical protein
MPGVRALTSLGLYGAGMPNLSGLENITSVDSLGLFGNPNLVSLSGLSSLTSLLTLSASGNPRLPVCAITALEAQTGVVCGEACHDNTGTGSCD